MDARERWNDGEVVGDDRDADSILDALGRGVSIVLVGPLGSGKSHFIRHLVDMLADSGESPLVLRSGGPMSPNPHAALAASSDPRAARLREGRPSNGDKPIVIIDDVQELDAASVAAVVRAVYGGHATALFALTVSRDGSTRPIEGNPDAAQMAVDLWLRGLADRVDLVALTPRDADQLLDVFAAPDLDALTRATIIALSDGSRMLLRELAAEAAHALRQGRDPINAIRDSPPNGRLSDALGAHVAQLGPSERMTLAALGRVPRIGRAHAIRFLPSTAVDALIATRLVHDDATPAHRLTANPALARVAARRAGAEGVDALLDGALKRMLAPTNDWWCVALSVLAAQSWLHGDTLGPAYDDVLPAIRARAALDAARDANDNGEAALAAAYAELGARSGDDAALLLEREFAEGAQGGHVDFEALLERLATESLDTATLLRCVRIAATVHGLDVSTLMATSERLRELVSPDPRAAVELTLMQAGFHGSLMNWADSAALSEGVFADQANSMSQRMRAAVAAGLSHTCLGAWQEGQAWFVRAHRCAGERGGISSVTTAERLHLATVEIVAAAITGTDLRTALARLGGEVDAAARQGDPETTSIAGLVLACAYAAVGEASKAARELEAGVRRARPPAGMDWVPMAQIAVTRTLALAGSPAEARALLDRIDPAAIAGWPSIAHARLVAESYVLASLSRHAEALAAARVAAEASLTSPALLARDLYEIVVLGDVDQALPRLRRIAEETDVPSARRLFDIASTLRAPDRAEPDIMASLRKGTTWDVNGDVRPGIGIAHERRYADAQSGAGNAGDPGDLELTRREFEIALLVADGLGNREIAERLYLSVRTVESHVYQARAKVGARSRAELGRTVVPPRRAAGRDHVRS